MTPMTLERALEVALRLVEGKQYEAEHPQVYSVPVEATEAAAVLRAFMETGLPFYRAAEAYFDSKGVRCPSEVREGRYDEVRRTHRAMKEGTK